MVRGVRAKYASLWQQIRARPDILYQRLTTELIEHKRTSCLLEMIAWLKRDGKINA